MIKIHTYYEKKSANVYVTEAEQMGGWMMSKLMKRSQK